MRIAFNALSVTNLSGRHVLAGHVRRVIEETADLGRHLLLYHASNRDLCQLVGGKVDLIECPSRTAQWIGRWHWERFRLMRLLQSEGVDILFSPAGVTTPSVTVPQVVLAQNPWCFVPQAQSGPVDWLKARLQRSAYRRAQREAALMCFNSEYMRRSYRDNAGFDPADTLILYQGLDEETFEAARATRSFDTRRCEVLVVSAMARHKSIEDVVRAVCLLRTKGVGANLKLVGPWPDRAYKREIEELVEAMGLIEHVEFVGYVSRDQLHRFYGEARVFCLLSRCESFGIPSVEAEAFGTPAVVADCGAPPEIAGPGGVVVPPGDPRAAADKLEVLLTDAGVWTRHSARARANAERFHWESCSRTLVESLVALGPS